MHASIYTIATFRLHGGKSKSLLLTETSVVKLESSPMYALLEELSRSGRMEIDDHDLNEICSRHQIPVKNAVDFLLKCKVLRFPRSESLSSTNTVAVYTDWDTTFVPIKYALEEAGARKVEIFTLESLSNFHRHGGKYAIAVLLLEKYSDELIHRFYNAYRDQPDAFLLVAFFRLRIFCISSPYYISGGTPCHFCQVEWEKRFEDQVRATGTLTSMLRAFESSGHKEIGEPPLQALDFPAAGAYLAGTISQLVGASSRLLKLDEVFQHRELNLINMGTKNFAAAHWPGCDCQFSRA